MQAIQVDKYVLIELYNFLIDYYDDPSIAEFVFLIFGIEKKDLVASDVPFDKFQKLLQYLHSMSGDSLICRKAGMYFEKKRIFQGLSIPGVRFFIRSVYASISAILSESFPGFVFRVSGLSRGSAVLEVQDRERGMHIDYFFAEYLRGILSSIPNHWKLPSSAVTIESYPFPLDDLLRRLDLPYRKDGTVYQVRDKDFAVEKSSSDTSPASTSAPRPLQTLTDDFFVKDIAVQKGTVFNAGILRFSVAWKNLSIRKSLLFMLLHLCGIPGFVYLLANQALPVELSIALFTLYELGVALLSLLFRYRALSRIYGEIESSLSHELAEQKRTTGEAIFRTYNRMQSIENLMEITKQIIHEKNISNLIDTIRKLSAKALGAERATVFIHDRDHHEFTSGPEFSDERQEMRIPEDKGVLGQVFKLKKIVNVKDAYNNPLFNKAIDKQTGFHTRTILSAPLLDLENNFIGVIQVLNKTDGEFQYIDEQILETLSIYIATALKDTLTIRTLERRGFDSDIINGLGTVTKHLYDRFRKVQLAIKEINDPKTNAVYREMMVISSVLDKLKFLFDNDATVHGGVSTAGKIVESIDSFISMKKADKDITFVPHLSFEANQEIFLDRELFISAISAMLDNSIESIGDCGRIEVYLFNFVEISNNIVHELSLKDLMTAYNAYGPENGVRFVEFVKSRKPFLESDLRRIIDAQREFVALDLFDSGAPIDPGIREKVFNPFFSTKNRFGLGLAIAKAAVVRMGGRLEAPRNENDGKSIRMLIPVNTNNTGQ